MLSLFKMRSSRYLAQAEDARKFMTEYRRRLEAEGLPSRGSVFFDCVEMTEAQGERAQEIWLELVQEKIDEQSDN